MERMCYEFTIRPGTESEYDRRHAELPRELADTIAAAGFTNYSLFRRATRVVVYGECVPDVETAFARLEGSAVVKRWAAYGAEVIDHMPDGRGDRFAEVWHLD